MALFSDNPEAYRSKLCNSADAGGDADADTSCSDAALADTCCCQLDVVAQPICDNGQWNCPPGFSHYTGGSCTSCPGPCCLPVDAGIDGDASDAASE